MKPIVPVLVASLLAVGCVRPPDVDLSEARSDAIEDSVATFLSAWSEGVEATDWDRLIERYADDPDFTWVEDGQVRYRSRGDLRAAFDGLQGQFSATRTEFLDPSIIPLAPGLANVVADYRTTLRRDGGENVSFGGVMTMTTVHTDDGWKVLQGHASSGTPRQPSEEGGPGGE